MRTPRAGRRPIVPHSELLRRQLGLVREARQQRVVRELHRENVVLRTTAEVLTLRNAFFDRAKEIIKEFSKPIDLNSLMKAVRKALERLGSDENGPAEDAWGVDLYRYSKRSSVLWSVPRNEDERTLKGESRYKAGTLILPGEKRYFIYTGKDRGFPNSETDILLIDRFVDFEKMSPDDRAAAEADFERDMRSYFGDDYRATYADRLDQLREALRYNLYVRWPGFEHYDAVIMANNHVRNAQRIKKRLPLEPFFFGEEIAGLTYESLRDLQIAFTNKLIAVENSRRNELNVIRSDALNQLRTALDQGKTPEELYGMVLDMLPKLFPRSREESYLQRGSMSIMTYDEEDGVLRIADARGLKGEIIRNTRIRPGETIAGKVFETGEALVISDVTALPEIAAGRTAFDRVAKGSALIVPLATEQKTYGLLSISSDHPKAFRDEDLSFASKVAAILADKMLRLSLHNRDEDTGLYLRKPGVRRINNMLEKALREGLNLAFIMIDLDKFKRINDRYGHEAGDKVIAATTRIIMEVVRKHKKEYADHVEIRWGNGEEFVVAALGADASQAMALAEELRLAIQKQSHKFLGPGDFITASLGVALYPDHGTVLEEVARHADRAVYDSKDGRNRVTFYDPTDRNLRDSTIP